MSTWATAARVSRISAEISARRLRSVSAFRVKMAEHARSSPFLGTTALARQVTLAHSARLRSTNAKATRVQTELRA